MPDAENAYRALFVSPQTKLKMKNKEITSLLNSTFAQCAKVEDLKTLANAICAQVKEAYEIRCKEITTGKPATKAKTKKTSEKEPKATSPKTLISVTDANTIKKLGLNFTFSEYNERCWVLRGDTKPLKVILKEKFEGKFNPRLKGGPGWIIRNAHVAECAKALGIKIP